MPPRHRFLFWEVQKDTELLMKGCPAGFEEHLCHWRLCCWHTIDPIYQSPLDCRFIAALKEDLGNRISVTWFTQIGQFIQVKHSFGTRWGLELQELVV